MTKNHQNEDDNKNSKDVNIQVPFTSIGFTGYAPTVWITGNFSKAWYEDANREAGISDNLHARRREILFSVCFLETFLFEWARDIVGKESIDDYFPYNRPNETDQNYHRYRRSLIYNWKNLPTELFDEGKIAINPNLNTNDLIVLNDYRNHLVHAHVSRPQSSDQPSELNLKRSPADIDRLSPGWARDIAKNLVLDLNNALNTTPPDYF